MIFRFFKILILSTLLLSEASYANLQDPTRPVNFVETQTNVAEVWELQAIIISKRGSLAIFNNGQTLRLGSMMSGFKVVAIQANAVHLEGPDGRMTLFLFNQSVKRAVGRINREED